MNLLKMQQIIKIVNRVQYLSLFPNLFLTKKTQQKTKKTTSTTTKTYIKLHKLIVELL